MDPNHFPAGDEAILIDKQLSPTDIKHRLSFPIASLLAFNPIPQGQHCVLFPATDTFQQVWNLKLSVRRNENDPNRRPEVTGDWLSFVREKKLEVGYKIILTRVEANGIYQYRIRAFKKIFGFWAPVV